MTHFDEDLVVLLAACGLQVHRRTIIRIDPKALPAKYWRRTPDYGKIRKALDELLLVPGAELTTGVEWVVVKKEADSDGDNGNDDGSRG